VVCSVLLWCPGLEDGQALAEYGLLLALIAVVCIVALTALGLAIAGTLSTLTAKL
jgi:pilus assembly protein Flp/PilA